MGPGDGDLLTKGSRVEWDVGMHSNAIYTHIHDSLLLSVSRVFPVEYSIPFCLEQASRGAYFRFHMFWPFQHQETGVNFKKFLDLYCPS